MLDTMYVMRIVVFFVCMYVVVGQDINQMDNMPKYDSRYDYFDVDAIFTNKRLVRNYVDCLINAHRCTPEGKALKRLLPEALRTKCVRCTERQKRGAVKVIKRLKYEYPEEWAKVASKWDPTGDFTRYFEEFLDKDSSNIIPGSGSTVNEVVVATSTPVPLTNPPPSVIPLSTPPRPVVLNRFGGDGELMVGSSSSAAATPRPTQPQTTVKPTTNMRPAMPTRPTMTTVGSGSALPTRFTLRPSSSELPLPITTAITIIDQIGYKIIRTTELVTDILKNTVRAVVGR